MPPTTGLARLTCSKDITIFLSPHRKVGMKKTCFDLVAEQEPDVSREPPDLLWPSINWTRWPGTCHHAPSKAEARISEGQVLCAGGAASPASVWEFRARIFAIVAKSVGCMYEDATPVESLTPGPGINAFTSDVAGELVRFSVRVLVFDAADHDIFVMSSSNLSRYQNRAEPGSNGRQTRGGCARQGSPDCHWCMHVCGFFLLFGAGKNNVMAKWCAAPWLRNPFHHTTHTGGSALWIASRVFGSRWLDR